jgi:ketosteroid isomerase-like protein
VPGRSTALRWTSTACADHGRALVLYHFTGRGKTSGLELGQIQTKGANVFHVRDGKVTRLIQYLDSERALAGLTPEGGSSGTERPG